MRHITSADNPLLKQIARLQKKPTAYRDEGLVLLEGEHLILECLQSQHAPQLQCILLSEAALDAQGNLPRWALSCEADELLDAIVTLAPQRLLAPLASGSHAAHVFALMRLPELVDARHDVSTVLLNGVQDAGNVGTILRTAAAAGFTQALLDDKCAAAWSPKVLRAAMGAHSHMSIYEIASISEWLSEASVTSIAADAHAQTLIYDAKLAMPCAWLMGSEGQGIDASLLALCKQHVRIPQANVESLNVASAAAICLYESVRQTRQLG